MDDGSDSKQQQKLLLDNKVIQLTNENVLYIKDWRK